jgi:ATP-dependent exoDNAse (exonuclease V) alpha subunit
LLYTAITRARSRCVVVADPRALDRAIRRSDAAWRHTGLKTRLQVALGIAPHWDADETRS